MTTLFPMLARELRAGARRRSTYTARTIAGFGACGFAICLLLVGLVQFLAPAAAGMFFFNGLTVVGYLFALFNGTISTCDCISREKREGTLELLFLTRLNAFDVILGKFVPRFTHLLYCLLAAIPSMACVFILGGVTFSGFLTAAIGVANDLFFFTSLGMLISTLSRNEKGVFATAIGLSIMIGIGIPAWGGAMGGLGPSPLAFTCISIGPVGTAAAGLFPHLVPSGSGWFLIGAFVLNQVVAWLFLISSGMALPRSVRDAGRTESRLHKSFCRPFSLRKQALPSKTKSHGDTWWQVNPMFEAAIRFDLGKSSPTARFLILFLLLLTALLAYPKGWLLPEGWQASSGFPNDWYTPPIFPAALLLLHLLLKFAVTGEACHALSTERRNGSLELLLVTPMSEDMIIRGQLLAIKNRYAMPVFLIVAFQALLLVSGLVQLRPMEQLVLTGLFCASTVWLLFDLYALAWVGLWCGLNMANTDRAIVQTILSVLIFPWLIFLAYLVIMPILLDCAGGRLTTEMLKVPLFCVSPCFYAAGYVGIISWAMYCLSERFRTVVSAPFGTKH